MGIEIFKAGRTLGSIRVYSDLFGFTRGSSGLKVSKSVGMLPVKLVEMQSIDKAFPGVQALAECRFDLRAGEVHALVGENGAGKSTLMKVLTGVHQPDGGRVLYKGKEVRISGPRAALDLGISMIHQELNLIPHLTVAQNIFVGREPRRWGFLLDEKAINQKTGELSQSIHLDLDPRARVMDLTVAKQQMVEIAKAVSYDADVVIMDEPTSALTDAEIRELFRIIDNLKARGVGVVYISHRMDEIMTISDRVTVMRDGRWIDTMDTKDATIDGIIRRMVGREVYQESRAESRRKARRTLLEVRGLTRKGVIEDISFELKEGEILGFAGLMGAGRTETARAIFGADPIDAGEIYVRGRRVLIRSPRDAVKEGIGYLSEDRKRFGLTLGLGVDANIALASYEKFTGRGGIIRSRVVRTTAQQQVEQLDIRTPGVWQQVRRLSGGNQQKVVIAKWLVRDCDVLIFDEPTRGIDVGAKNEVYQLLNELARQGKAIIMISSELPEVLRMSHRIIVMCEGRITGELSGDEATEERIMEYATMRETMSLGGR